jgi:hypothetical protein
MAKIVSHRATRAYLSYFGHPGEQRHGISAKLHASGSRFTGLDTFFFEGETVMTVMAKCISSSWNSRMRIVSNISTFRFYSLSLNVQFTLPFSTIITYNPSSSLKLKRNISK